MKYDEIVNFVRQGPPGCPGKIFEKYKIHIADGHVDFVHGRPVYKATESKEFRFVQTWFWRDWTLDIDDPLQCNHEHARNTARGPYLLLSHLPANLGDKRTVVLFSPSAAINFDRRTGQLHLTQRVKAGCRCRDACIYDRVLPSLSLSKVDQGTPLSA